jgi:small subunit ribosomal protein S1
LCPDPWSLVATKYKPGDLIEAQITNVMPFGAFAKLPEGVEGLVHTSELAEGSFLHPRDVVCEGQVVQARILNVDPARQRIGLSLRLNAERPPRVVHNASEPPPPPDAGYWESLARED